MDVFFVISGFVIAGLLLRELEATGRVDLGRFYSRRVRRLFPALALLVGVVALSSVAFASAFGASVATAQTGLGALAFMANVAIYQITGGYFDAPATTNALLHTWSLSVEEQFYLVFPALLVAAYLLGRRWLRGRGRETAAVVLLLVGGCSFVLSMRYALLTDLGIHKPDVFAFYSSPTRAWEFAFGAVIALAAPTIARVPRTLGTIGGVVGAVLVLASGLVINAQTPFPGWATLLPVAGAALLIASGIVTTGLIARILSSRPLVWIGDRSYSWYLWHWPVIVLSSSLVPVTAFTSAAAAGLSLIPASLSYGFVEQPIRTSRAIRGRRMAALVGVCVIVPAIVCAAIVVRPAAEPKVVTAALTPDEAMAAQITPSHIGGVCFGLAPGDPAFGATCTWNAQASGEPIYLVGDSQADMLSEALVAAAGQLHRRLVISDYGDCPFIDVQLFRGGQLISGCGDHVQRTVDLLTREPGTVVIASGEFTVLSDSWTMAPASGGDQAVSVADKAAIYRAGLSSIVDRLTTAGNQIVVVQPVPHFYAGWIEDLQNRWEPSLCPALQARTNPAQCGTSVSLTAVISNQAPVFDANTAVAQEFKGSTVDLRPDLCSAGVCSTNRGNTWLYKDGAHITAQESEQLGPAFARALGVLVS